MMSRRTAGGSRAPGSVTWGLWPPPTRGPNVSRLPPHESIRCPGYRALASGRAIVIGPSARRESAWSPRSGLTAGGSVRDEAGLHDVRVELPAEDLLGQPAQLDQLPAIHAGPHAHLLEHRHEVFRAGVAGEPHDLRIVPLGELRPAADAAHRRVEVRDPPAHRPHPLCQ